MCALSEDSNQPAQLHNLIGILTVQINGLYLVQVNRYYQTVLVCRFFLFCFFLGGGGGGGGCGVLNVFRGN